MKKSLLITLAFFTGMLMADSFEVKTGEGPRAHTTPVKGVFRSKYESNFPYVCYDKRVKVTVDSKLYLMYKGCSRFDVSCKQLGRAHFGKYPNDLKAHQALQRCRNAKPKFVD
jgi:hypothetical protein